MSMPTCAECSIPVPLVDLDLRSATMEPVPNAPRLRAVEVVFCSAECKSKWLVKRGKRG